MKRTTLNYIIYILIGLGFLTSAVTGIYLFFTTSGGYKGGSNPQYFIHALWMDVHAWSSIIMSVGVTAHLVLHWNWMVCMTCKLFSQKKRSIPGIPGMKTACEVVGE